MQIAKRFRAWLRVVLVAIDQLAFVILAGPYFWVKGGEAPSPRETISSKVGREANNGRTWAKAAQQVIDGLFRLLGSKPGHCQRAILAPYVLVLSPIRID